jgi:hypothetical protein
MPFLLQDLPQEADVVAGRAGRLFLLARILLALIHAPVDVFVQMTLLEVILDHVPKQPIEPVERADLVVECIVRAQPPPQRQRCDFRLVA